MGKPYKFELDALSATFEWAASVNIERLRRTVRNAATVPLIPIGSGGSFTAAHFLAGLHRRRAKQVSSPLTPLETILDPLPLNSMAWMLTASGENVDILSSYTALVGSNLRQIAVLCGRSGSTLVKRARALSHIDIFETEFPAGRDGFLATNSLLAFITLLARAYTEEMPNPGQNPDSMLRQVERYIGNRKGLERWKKESSAVLDQQTILVLYGPGCRSGAVDIESKFTEAALGQIQLADYRNFAHGRHHWLAKRGSTSGVIALISPEDRQLAEKTISLLPDWIPTSIVNFEGSAEATEIQSVVAALHLTQWAGEKIGIDPGRPGVPEFGRKIYNLRIPKRPTTKTLATDCDAVAVEQKIGEWAKAGLTGREAKTLVDHLKKFKASLSKANFQAIVLDYDGTLVETRDRFLPPTKEIAAELNRILDAGTSVGIATGRGASVLNDLKFAISEKHWKSVWIGYYNGSEIRTIDDGPPDNSDRPCEQLQAVAKLIATDIALNKIANVTNRKNQITLEAVYAGSTELLWLRTNELVRASKSGASVTRSSHSIDVIPAGVTKLNVVRHLESQLGARDILKIGDRGQWPGNDVDLLYEPHSLSVDEVSGNLDTCWKLAPRGLRGVPVTLRYLKALKRNSKKTGLEFRVGK